MAVLDGILCGRKLGPKLQCRRFEVYRYGRHRGSLFCDLQFRDLDDNVGTGEPFYQS